MKEEPRDGMMVAIELFLGEMEESQDLNPNPRRMMYASETR